MDILEEGSGELLAWYDPDEAYDWISKNKSRDLKDKRMSLAESIKRFLHDGDYLVLGGFGHVRIPTAAIYEAIRCRKKNLIIAANPGVHDLDLLIASGCVDKVEVAYAFGHELRGLSPASGRAIKNGDVKVSSEISNAGLQWRLKAAAMGLPFLPSRIMLGSDTLRYSPAKIVKDPFSGKPICLLPACHPDIAIIHVHRCDKSGNAQIDGITVMDLELARAARRLIITTERIIDENTIRNKPWRTVIPYYLVDSVVETPYGSHPGNMPYLYYSDEEHFAEWLESSKTTGGVEKYLKKYVYDVSSFEEYLDLIGGSEKLRYLEQLEGLNVPLKAPWAYG